MAGGSKLTVYSAIAANSVVTVAKFIGFGLTGSGAMLSEGIHSSADVGNQVLLAVGMSRSERAPDPDQPMGGGREAFVWALISAVGIFFLGCGVTVMHGIESLQHPHAPDPGSMNINVGILVFALVAEGITLAIAVHQLKKAADHRKVGFVHHLKTTDDPFGVAVLLEDSAAVFGVLVALTAVVLTHYTHNPYWDAIGSLTIGALLGLVAVFLIWKNSKLLIGQAIPIEDRERIRELLEAEPAVQSIVKQTAVVTGAQSFRVSAELEFDGGFFADRFLEGKDLVAMHKELDSPEALRAFLHTFGEHMVDDVGDEVDRIERRLHDQMPKAGFIALEPD